MIVESAPQSSANRPVYKGDNQVCTLHKKDLVTFAVISIVLASTLSKRGSILGFEKGIKHVFYSPVVFDDQQKNTTLILLNRIITLH